MRSYDISPNNCPLTCSLPVKVISEITLDPWGCFSKHFENASNCTYFFFTVTAQDPFHFWNNCVLNDVGISYFGGQKCSMIKLRCYAKFEHSSKTVLSVEELSLNNQGSVCTQRGRPFSLG